ncbi:MULTISPECIES: hypothetical protein [Rothia]|uniref:hypothetical protein n=1 Tax=Rothia TaxID=32207 RepID=UPI001F19CE90|nr:hypothetical protein [Rothia nasimurium]
MANSRWRWLYPLGVTLWFIVAFAISINIIVWFFTSVVDLESEQWRLIGEISRNTNALAVLAASVAAWIAWGTNKARKEEAKRADFKDRIQWAVSRFDGSPSLESMAAGKMIDQFAQDKGLSANDTELAIELADHKKFIEQDVWRRVEVLLNSINSSHVKLKKLLNDNRISDLAETVSPAQLAQFQRELAQKNLDYLLSSVESRETESVASLKVYQASLDSWIQLLEDLIAGRWKNDSN